MTPHQMLEPGAAARAPRSGLGSHPDPGHPLRHPRHAWQRDRQEAARPVERRLQRRGSSTRSSSRPCALDPAQHAPVAAPIPMKQSVIKNGKGEIVKYNHSKWLAISGNYGGNAATLDRALRVRQLEQLRLRAATSRCSSYSATPDPAPTSTPSTGRGTRLLEAARAAVAPARSLRLGGCEDGPEAARAHVRHTASTSTCPRGRLSPTAAPREGPPTHASRRTYVSWSAPLVFGLALRCGATGTDPCWRPCRWTGPARCPACR